MIAFEQVSKCYARQPRTFLESLARWGTRRAGIGSSGEAGFWALQDVSFTVTRGETLGIIGNNGAGKSTLLKLMAGITTPTRGRVEVQGRISSLIELGAGFNPDLTGLENIYLNGAVLGLSRREIDECRDQITSFSGLGDFLKVPVKYYSSGMYARLGFAIAAHVRADVILTDEILAVGDAAFQRQCLRKFKELQDASTIVFVAHDLVRIKEICSRVIWIERGRLQGEGEAGKVVEAYLRAVQQDRDHALRSGGEVSCEPGERRRGTGNVEIQQIETCDEKGRPRMVFRSDEPLLVRIRYRVRKPCYDPGFGINIMSQDGVFVHGTNTFIHGMGLDLTEEAGMIELMYPTLPLVAGTYWLTAGVASDNDWSMPYDLRERVCKFEVLSTRRDGGLVCVEHRWSNPVSEG
jgi:ABC-type polysaccharide/polyol phosphate transport system ATPase subunit